MDIRRFGCRTSSLLLVYPKTAFVLRGFKIPTLKEVIFAIIINVVSNGIFVLMQAVSGVSIYQQVPIWVLSLSIGIVLTVSYLIVLRLKVDPFLKLVGDLKTCIEDFEKFFNHPHYAIMPNPFNNEPELEILRR